MKDKPRRVAFIANGLAPDLQTGKRNVERLYDLLKDREVGACDLCFRSVDARSRYALQEEFDKALAQCRATDVLIFYFSGHGQRAADGQFEIACADHWLPFSDLIREIAKRKIATGVLLLDACSSEEAVHDLKKLPGFTLLASSKSLEPSYEPDGGDYSVFTDLLCNGIESGLGEQPTNDGFIAVEDLARYINAQREKRYKEWRQHSVWTHSAERIWIAKNRTPVTGSVDDKYISTYCDKLLAGCDRAAWADAFNREHQLSDIYVPLRLRPYRDPKRRQDGEERGTLGNSADELQRQRSGRDMAGTAQPAALGELLAREQGVLIFGEQGAGKTTLLRWLARAVVLGFTNDPNIEKLRDAKTLPGGRWLPVLVHCQDLAEVENLELWKIITHALEKMKIGGAQIKKLAPYLHDLGTSEKDDSCGLMLLLDGLDTISSADRRKQFCKALETIVTTETKGRVRILITARCPGYEETAADLSNICKAWTIDELDDEAKAEFVRQWVELAEEPDRRPLALQQLLQAISSDRLRWLTGRPLVLTTLVLVRGKLFSRRHELYQEAINVLLSWQPAVGSRLTSEEVLPQLQYVAFDMCRRGVQRISKADMLDLLNDMRDQFPDVAALQNHEPQDFLEALERRTNLLIAAGAEQRDGVPAYEFMHSTFQAYLTGMAILEGFYPQDDDDLDDNIPLWERISTIATREREEVGAGDEIEEIIPTRWTDALRIAVAACRHSEVAPVLRSILRPAGNRGRFARPNVCLAALCLADEVDVTPQLAQEILVAFAQSATVDGVEAPYGTDTLRAVAKELSRSKWRATLVHVVAEQFLTTPSESRNPLFILALSSLGQEIPCPSSPFTWDRYVECHKEWRDEQFRWLNERLLSFCSSPQPMEIVLAGFKVLLALRKWELNEYDGRAVSLQHALRLCDMTERSDGPIGDLAISILRDLNRFGLWVPRVEDLSRLVKAVSAVTHDAGIFEALAQIVGARCFGEGASLCVRLMQDSPWSTQEWAVWAISRLKSQETLPELFRLLDSSAHKRVRQETAHALGNFPAHGVGDRLIRVLKEDDDEFVRVAACEALGKLRDAAAIPSLVKCLGDKSASVSAAACRALGYIREGVSVNKLASKANDPNAAVREQAIYALGRIGDWTHAETIIQRTRDPERDVRLAAVRVLGRCTLPEAVGALAEAVRESSWLVRDEAARSLGRIGSPAARDQLIGIFQDTTLDHAVRSAAAAGLGMLNDSAVRTALLKGLDDPSDQVRTAAATQLGVLRAAEALEPLLDHLSKGSPDLRRTIIEALGRIGHERAVLGIIDCLADPSGDIRNAAVIALQLINASVAYVDELLNRARDSEGEILQSFIAALSAGRELAVLPLVNYLDEECEEGVRAAAAEALGWMGNHPASDVLGGHLAREAAKPLADLLTHEQVSVKTQVSAVAALGAIRAVEYRELIERHLSHGPITLRRAAAEALGKIGNPESAASLVDCLHSVDAWLRNAAVSAIAQARCAGAVAEVVHCLGDSFYWVRVSAARALGEIGDAERIDGLVRCLTESDYELRAVAAKSLGELKALGALDLLVHCLGDPVESVQIAAAEALGEIGEETAIPAVKKLFEEDSSDVRSAALGSIVRLLRDPGAERLLTIDPGQSLSGWWDPHSPISDERVQFCAEALKTTEAEVRQDYERIAVHFNLRLTWRETA